jgi:hypothetical protein
MLFQMHARIIVSPQQAVWIRREVRSPRTALVALIYSVWLPTVIKSPVT